MLGKVKAMLGFGTRKLERPAPDQITADLVIARQKNEIAGERARALLLETLERNDSLRSGG